MRQVVCRPRRLTRPCLGNRQRGSRRHRPLCRCRGQRAGPWRFLPQVGEHVPRRVGERQRRRTPQRDHSTGAAAAATKAQEATAARSTATNDDNGSIRLRVTRARLRLVLVPRVGSSAACQSALRQSSNPGQGPMERFLGVSARFRQLGRTQHKRISITHSVARPADRSQPSVFCPCETFRAETSAHGRRIPRTSSRPPTPSPHHTGLQQVGLLSVTHAGGTRMLSRLMTTVPQCPVASACSCCCFVIFPERYGKVDEPL